MAKVQDMKIKKIVIFNRSDFRKWLAKNHEKEKRVSLIIYKKHTKRPSPSHRELMEEAICFGWIDTTLNRLDEDKYARTFVRRNKNSKWSENTIRYAKELIKQKKMTPSGLKFYKEGLKKPTHDLGIPKNPDMPIELKLALKKDKKANKNFEKITPSTKKMLYRWILRAKREETRIKRVRLIIKNAREGKKNILQ
ncbi:MAG: YdeI/OmpD-associated family protein [archaeon]